MNIVNHLLASSLRTPDKIAVVYKDQTITYKELKERILCTAYGLREYGLKENTNIALTMQNGPDYIVAYYALLSLGATIIPINPLFKVDEMTYILNNSDAEAVICDDTAIETITIAKKGLKKITKIICTNDNHQSDIIKWADICSFKQQLQPVQCNFDDTAHIIYTSGTTGRPKGAMITHGNLNWMTITNATVLEVKPYDRFLCVLPLFHVYAKIQCMMVPFVQGATTYIEERFTPNQVLESIEKNKITIFFGVPTMFNILIHSEKIKLHDFGSLRICGSGGASIATEVINKVKQEMGVNILEGYGQTESTTKIAVNPYRGTQKIGSVGLALPGVEVKIVNSSGDEVVQGAVGEIVFRGPNVMKGYYNNPEETIKTIRNNWVFTGDIGYVDEDDYIYIIDRKKDMIIRGGYNVYPREIEEVIYKYPGIVECAVIGKVDPIYGEEIVAYIVSDRDVSKQELVSYCKQFLAHYKIPRIIQRVDNLPKSSTGKILKTEIRKLVK
ncbi:hypothetical protein BTR23_22645 [Alkalihalophilus pseudofirmus]|nr:hypothetical protein BTR23_22645 [Alkalihalophilus pseudofirmus]